MVVGGRANVSPSQSPRGGLPGELLASQYKADAVAPTPWLVEVRSGDVELQEDGDHLCLGPAPLFRGCRRTQAAPQRERSAPSIGLLPTG